MYYYVAHPYSTTGQRSLAERGNVIINNPHNYSNWRPSIGISATGLLAAPCSTSALLAQGSRKGVWAGCLIDRPAPSKHSILTPCSRAQRSHTGPLARSPLTYQRHGLDQLSGVLSENSQDTRKRERAANDSTGRAGSTGPLCTSLHSSPHFCHGHLDHRNRGTQTEMTQMKCDSGDAPDTLSQQEK